MYTPGDLDPVYKGSSYFRRLPDIDIYFRNEVCGIRNIMWLMGVYLRNGFQVGKRGNHGHAAAYANAKWRAQIHMVIVIIMGGSRNIKGRCGIRTHTIVAARDTGQT